MEEINDKIEKIDKKIKDLKKERQELVDKVLNSIPKEFADHWDDIFHENLIRYIERKEGLTPTIVQRKGLFLRKKDKTKEIPDSTIKLFRNLDFSFYINKGIRIDGYSVVEHDYNIWENVKPLLELFLKHIEGFLLSLKQREYNSLLRKYKTLTGGEKDNV